ncbi:ATP-binding cassette domain-containing protein [Kocuria koreensis]|jgi:ABC-2 type transport system ATP-binding protein|uniref:ATP-binding cassette domain-containing protein n=1 Tax=Rothia koreensis TaxID=592378 RepID=A0A7K1LFA5_9MICC|nr:ABC transporter ATP-binding protein [Rothia koreensis]MUN53866.1 ATP-binding cassette domain-containing protein [Rothia koreensis]
MNNTVIEAQGLIKSFKDGSGRTFNAVDGVNVEVGSGEIIGLLGPNGAGKSTLIDMVLGLTKPSSGTVRTFGGTPHQAIAHGRIGAVLQTGGLLPNLTVRDTIRMIAATHRNPLPLDTVLDQADLTHLADRKVVKCSGGEQQRIRFALAILSSPDLLILDEPTSGMDANARHTFWESMKTQASSGRTIVFATHYIEEAQNFAQRIIMVGNGRVVVDGPTDDVRAHAAPSQVSAVLPDDVEASSLPGVQSVSIDGDRTTMTTDQSDELARHLLTRTGATGLTISAGSLEDAFLALTTDRPEASFAGSDHTH